MAKKKQVSEPELLDQLVILENKWKRALADYQNLEKRISTQQASYVKLASVGVIDKLLPVLDDLKRAAAHIKDTGIELIVKRFEEVLESEGVLKIEALGKVFDPSIMECVEMTEGEANVVIEVLQEGYQIDSTVIRPAKVTVGAGKKTTHKQNTQTEKEE
jgi:molecular chaperone GrpE